MIIYNRQKEILRVLISSAALKQVWSLFPLLFDVNNLRSILWQ